MRSPILLYASPKRKPIFPEFQFNINVMFSRVAFRASETRPKNLDDKKLLQITPFRLAKGKRPQYTVPVN